MSGWRCRDRLLPVRERVHVMGILNVTPDSFSDGGRYAGKAAAVRWAKQMIEEGADVIDVGGESTRPGAHPVSLSEELERVVPVISEVVGETGVAVSVDTTKSEVARAALEAGAVIVNDVSALRFDPDMSGVVAKSGAGVVLMHMLGEPRTMQDNPTYGDVVAEVKAALVGWAREAGDRGIAADQVVIDPGIGFGKTRGHNLTLLRSLEALTDAGYPVMVGPSRKSFIGTTLDLPVDDRVEGTAAAVAWAVAAGASIVRVHEVRQMTRVVRMAEAIRSA
jgi:dihydropteroate synthase